MDQCVIPPAFGGDQVLQSDVIVRKAEFSQLHIFNPSAHLCLLWTEDGMTISVCVCV